jgi:hypothetical protein
MTKRINELELRDIFRFTGPNLLRVVYINDGRLYYLHYRYSSEAWAVDPRQSISAKSRQIVEVYDKKDLVEY